jgi:hypothetical protein
MPLCNTPHGNVVHANNALRLAEDKLTKATCATEAKEFLRPLREALLIQTAPAEGARGLAAFVCPGFHRVFQLPGEFTERAFVDRRFYILPLLRFFSKSDRIYILALSQKHIRLFEANRAGANEVVVEHIPSELGQSHQDFQSEGFRKELQFHAASAGAGKGGVIYHGGSDEPKDRFASYLHKLSSELFKSMNMNGAPLVLASVGWLASMYREMNPYPNLADGFVAGNPDLLTREDLHAKAWEVAETYFARERRRAVERFKRLRKTLMSSDPQEIANAARDGRVRVLFVSARGDKAGEDSEELLNMAASLTLQDGGKVYEVPAAEMPENMEVAAAYRY